MSHRRRLVGYTVSQLMIVTWATPLDAGAAPRRATLVGCHGLSPTVRLRTAPLNRFELRSTTAPDPPPPLGQATFARFTRCSPLTGDRCRRESSARALRRGRCRSAESAAYQVPYRGAPSWHAEGPDGGPAAGVLVSDPATSPPST